MSRFPIIRRRQFLRRALQSLSLYLTAPALLTSCSDEPLTIEPGSKKVLIVGGGIAGLAAAKKLSARGFAVTVLESRGKVGGRIRTDRSLGIPFDQGASWIHGPSGNPLTDLASQSGAETFLTDDENVRVFDIDGTHYTDRVLTRAESEFNDALEAVARAGSDTRSFLSIFQGLFPDRLDDRLWKYMLSAYLEFDTGGDIARLSSRYFYDDEAFSGSDLIVTNGYDRITDGLSAGLDIQLNTRVTAVDYSDSEVVVKTDTGSLSADYAVVCVPLGVLKKEILSFTPALPLSKRNAIAATAMGNVNKFLWVWNTPFWNTDLQYIGYTPETRGKFNYFLNLQKFTSQSALMSFAFGDYATATEGLTDAAVTDAAMGHLRNIYGNGIPAPVSLLRTRWGQDIHTFGAYSFATNGTTSADFHIMAEEVADKLFFAGEHTSREYRGTVHGAYLSGIREADKIIDLQ
ncbi:MAG: FAD-dependent oxidoreductase [Saprospiraceae bacterium]|nr:FAD-dependent oxidoreductase [Saprospiraceae bacterium]